MHDKIGPDLGGWEVGGYLNSEFGHTHTFASIALRDLRADGGNIDLINSLHWSGRMVTRMRFKFYRVCSISGASFYLLPANLRPVHVFATAPRHFHCFTNRSCSYPPIK